MALLLGAKQTFSYDPENSSIDLTEMYINVSKGLLSFPLNIPGTTYYKCLKVNETLNSLYNFVRFHMNIIDLIFLSSFRTIRR
jgi:hypothetical protein